jgi:hypothetical protein
MKYSLLQLDTNNDKRNNVVFYERKNSEDFSASQLPREVVMSRTFEWDLNIQKCC